MISFKMSILVDEAIGLMKYTLTECGYVFRAVFIISRKGFGGKDLTHGADDGNKPLIGLNKEKSKKNFPTPVL